LLSRPDVRSKLEAELATVSASGKSPKWSTLEQLPYFSGVLQEGLRFSYGVASRLPRVAPDETLVYEGMFGGKPVRYTIPPGTAIGMSSVIMHGNKDIFPNPDEFRPERWINEDGTRRKDLDAYLLTFGKGSRICLGIK
jgi:cytochrome P450